MTSTAHSTYCTAKTKNGQPCKAHALTNSQFCFAHDPTNAAVRAAAHSAGGRARHGRTIGQPTQPSEPVKLASIADVIKLLESEVNTVLGLEVSLSRAQTIARLALAFVKCFEVSEVTQRLAAIEWALSQRAKEEKQK